MVGAEGVGAGAVGEGAAPVVVGAGVVVVTAVGAEVGVLVNAGLAAAVAGADVGTAVVGAEVVCVEVAVAMETGADGKTGPGLHAVTRNNTTRGSTRNAGATITQARHRTPRPLHERSGAVKRRVDPSGEPSATRPVGKWFTTRVTALHRQTRRNPRKGYHVEVRH